MARPVLFLPALVAPVIGFVLATVPSGAARAQNTVIQAENVRFDYAQVLRVTPVYQTLRATSVEEQCESEEKDSRLSRVVGAVKEALTREQKEQQEAACRPVTVEREFRRPIAYDVDYVYKGAKYRSRLPEDPGNRLRIRVSVTPVVQAPRTR